MVGQVSRPTAAGWSEHQPGQAGTKPACPQPFWGSWPRLKPPDRTLETPGTRCQLSPAVNFVTLVGVISPLIEDYLKAIYYLQEDAEVVTTSALAERLGVASPSVTLMLQKLASHRPKLVQYERRGGASLTPAGRKIALEVVRHHRLIELYLAEELNYPWDEVHAEAEKLEHVISENLEDRMAERLGAPLTDPHGDPIPTKKGAVARPSRLTLSDLEVGQAARVTRVRDDDPALLRYLTELGIRLQTRVVVTERPPFDGPLQVTIGKHSHALNKNVTDRVFVELV